MINLSSGRKIICTCALICQSNLGIAQTPSILPPSIPLQSGSYLGIMLDNGVPYSTLRFDLSSDGTTYNLRLREKDGKIVDGISGEAYAVSSNLYAVIFRDKNSNPSEEAASFFQLQKDPLGLSEGFSSSRACMIQLEIPYTNKASFLADIYNRRRQIIAQARSKSKTACMLQE